MFSRGKIKNIFSNPNMLTLFRVAATPIIVILLLFPNRTNAFIAAMIFSAAAITDFLDGFLARQKGLVSNFGKVMDPIADKVLVSTSFIMLTALGWIPAWIVCVIIGREIAVTGLRNIIAEKGKDLSASSLGKYKTGFQIAAIIPLMIHFSYLTIDFHAIGTLFLWIALMLTVWSGAAYFIRYRNLLQV
ncbi:MAG: CDP-diacylglycerol--glycerol-3-phosphate 3-phosphatidyltransferase [Deltaproteobacteria bacterium]|jgi:CDP-diacylglycerol--glycerol-3-phosphate 3-phosphatidyltransferase|nr:CDP-diacylglycerol--glycerol-3-phosphate 3-phosphatidyltransferase [Deltaproteobacteria bacterium]